MAVLGLTCGTRDSYNSDIWNLSCEVKVLVAQSCLTLCNPMDGSLPGFFVHGILQERIPEWVAISFSRGSSWPMDPTWVYCIDGSFFTIWAAREALWDLVPWPGIELMLPASRAQNLRHWTTEETPGITFSYCTLIN